MGTGVALWEPFLPQQATAGLGSHSGEAAEPAVKAIFCNPGFRGRGVKKNLLENTQHVVRNGASCSSSFNSSLFI
jgi:hypothetical protein